jgi:protein-arginine kinase activator protein McsA
MTDETPQVCQVCQKSPATVHIGPFAMCRKCREIICAKFRKTKD